MLGCLLSRPLACAGMTAWGLILALSGSAQATLIDSFDVTFSEGEMAIFAAPGMPNEAEVNDLTGIIGGQREMVLSIEEGMAVAFIRPNGPGSLHQMQFQLQGPGDFASRLQLTYDGMMSGLGSFNPLGLNHAMLTGTSFLLRAMSNNPITATFRVFTDATNFSEAVVTTTPTGNVFQDFTVAFSDFDVGGGTGADFNDVGAIQIDLEVAGDATIHYGAIETTGSLAVVPEPGSWALVGLGALGVVGYSRLRRRKARLA